MNIKWGTKFLKQSMVVGTKQRKIKRTKKDPGLDCLYCIEYIKKSHVFHPEFYHVYIRLRIFEGEHVNLGYVDEGDVLQNRFKVKYKKIWDRDITNELYEVSK